MAALPAPEPDKVAAPNGFDGRSRQSCALTLDASRCTTRVQRRRLVVDRGLAFCGDEDLRAVARATNSMVPTTAGELVAESGAREAERTRSFDALARHPLLESGEGNPRERLRAQCRARTQKLRQGGVTRGV